MSADSRIDEQSPAVQAHLTIEQSVIQRMAGSAASCKAWAISIVSAILVVVADKGKPNLVYLAVVPTLLFFALDAYYLGLERMFRASYKDFIRKLHNKSLVTDDLFIIKPLGEQTKITLESLISPSVFPFYGCLLFTIFIVRYIIK